MITDKISHIFCVLRHRNSQNRAILTMCNLRLKILRFHAHGFKRPLRWPLRHPLRYLLRYSLSNPLKYPLRQKYTFLLFRCIFLTATLQEDFPFEMIKNIHSIRKSSLYFPKHYPFMHTLNVRFRSQNFQTIHTKQLLIQLCFCQLMSLQCQSCVIE